MNSPRNALLTSLLAALSPGSLPGQAPGEAPGWQRALEQEQAFDRSAAFRSWTADAANDELRDRLDRVLDALALAQDDDGRFVADTRFGLDAVLSTAGGVLAFTGAGSTVADGAHRRAVAQAVTFLESHVGEDGRAMSANGARTLPLAGHAHVVLALAEALRGIEQHAARPALSRATSVLVSGRTSTGLWPLEAGGDPADATTTGLALRALLAARLAGENVASDVVDKALDSLRSGSGALPDDLLAGRDRPAAMNHLTLGLLLCGGVPTSPPQVAATRLGEAPDWKALPPRFDASHDPEGLVARCLIACQSMASERTRFLVPTQAEIAKRMRSGRAREDVWASIIAARCLTASCRHPRRHDNLTATVAAAQIRARQSQGADGRADNVTWNSAVGLGGGAGGKFGGRGGGRSRLARSGANLAAAIETGLLRLRETQQEDGHWSNSGRSDVETTALALLAYLGDGSTLRSGPFRDQVKNSTRWMLDQIDETGRIGGSTNTARDQALATHALVECLGLSGYTAMRARTQLALDALRGMQQEDGGWIGNAAHDGTSTWAILAVRSARDFDLTTPVACLNRAGRWTEQQLGADAPNLGGAVFAAFFLSFSPRTSPAFGAAGEKLAAATPAWGTHAPFEPRLFGIYAAYQWGGAPWRTASKSVTETREWLATSAAEAAPAVTAYATLELMAFYRYTRLVR